MNLGNKNYFLINFNFNEWIRKVKTKFFYGDNIKSIVRTNEDRTVKRS